MPASTEATSGPASSTVWSSKMPRTPAPERTTTGPSSQGCDQTSLAASQTGSVTELTTKPDPCGRGEKR